MFSGGYMDYFNPETKSSFRTINKIKTSTHLKSGNGYFKCLTKGLATNLNLKWSFVGRFLPKGNCEIITMWDGIKFHEKIFYELVNTPCFKVKQNSDFYSCKSQLIKFFPNYSLAREWGVESYTGLPIFSSSGEVIGVLVVMDEKPLCSNLSCGLENIIRFFSTFRRIHAQQPDRSA